MSIYRRNGDEWLRALEKGVGREGRGNECR